MLEPYAPLNARRHHEPVHRQKEGAGLVRHGRVGRHRLLQHGGSAKKRNIPKPETWKDLTKPAYKGQIVMPNPASSGTGFFRRDGLADAVW
jgi:iron(III) transport system substrate-binding protein